MTTEQRAMEALRRANGHNPAVGIAHHETVKTKAVRDNDDIPTAQVVAGVVVFVLVMVILLAVQHAAVVNKLPAIFGG